MRQHASAGISIRQHTSAYLLLAVPEHGVKGAVDTRRLAVYQAEPVSLGLPCERHHWRRDLQHLHTSAYVSIRQHTSRFLGRKSSKERDFVSLLLRQHTSAYVSVRQQHLYRQVTLFEAEGRSNEYHLVRQHT